MNETIVALEGNHDTKISARNVDFFYGKFQTLFDISLDFKDREVTAVIGPS